MNEVVSRSVRCGRRIEAHMAQAERRPLHAWDEPDEPGGAAASARSFLRMVSHELRTPLNAVIGFSEIIACELHGPIGDPRYAAHARLVRESGLALLALVNQVLELARLEQGAEELDLRDEPLDEIIAEAVERVRAAAETAGVRLVRPDGAGEGERVLCDRRALLTILQALLSNALAAAPAGGDVTVTTLQREGRVVIEVRDEGQGFDPAELPRLMRPFEQGESTLVRAGGGAGLGLPIARLLCKAMGGRLHLESAPGRGVRARVRLPASRSQAASLA